MAIDKKLIKYATKSRFTTDLGNNLIPNSAVVYIIDTKELWTHGTYFGGFYTDVNTNYTTLTIGGTAVNLSKYGHTHNYLPLTGGTLTGNLSIQTGIDNKIILNNTDGEKYSKIVFQESGVEYAYILATNGNLQLYGIGDLLYNSNKVITSSNYSTYSLPLTGGTLTGTLNISELCRASDGSGVIMFSDKITKLCPANADSVTWIRSGNNDLLHYVNSGVTYTILDSNNYSTYALPLTGGTMSNTSLVTKLNADMLDGLHSTSFFRNLGFTASPGVDANTQVENNIDYTYENNAPLSGPIANFSCSGYGFQLLSNNGTTSTLAFRSHGDGTFRNWKTIAFTDSNVASATNADTVDSIHANGFLRYYHARTDVSNIDTLDGTSYLYTSADTGGYPSGTEPTNSTNACAILSLHTHSGNYYTQVAFSTNTNDLFIRSANFATAYGSWTKLLNESNYNVYAPKLDGTGATGNWNISAQYLLINKLTYKSNWTWTVQSGQPSWVWGTNDGVNMYPWNPSNFSFNYASSSGSLNSLLYRNRMQNPSLSPVGNGSIPYNILALRTGTPIYDDPEFSSGYNSIHIYNNTGDTSVTFERIADTQISSNSSGYIIRIGNTASTSSPDLGGFVQDIPARANATFIQIFRAKIPIGYTLVTHSNSQGDSSLEGWLTDNVGTGKWEWYARYDYCGQTGTFSDGGHISLAGTAGTSSAPVYWYLSYCNLYDITKSNYDGLRTKYSDSAIKANKLSSSVSLWGQTFDGSSNVTGNACFGTNGVNFRSNSGITIYQPSGIETSLFLCQYGTSSAKLGFLGSNALLYLSNTTFSSTMNNNYLAIDTVGNVGIGVTPSYKLHVAGTLGVTDTLTITSSANNKLYLNDTAGASNNGIFFQNNGTQYAQVLPTSTAFNLRGSGDLLYNGINVLTTSNYSSYALPLTGGKLTGNLGIGVTPTHALHVSGDSYFDGDMTLSNHNFTIYYGASRPKAIKFIGDLSGSYWTAAIVADYWGDTYNSSVHHGMSFIGGRSSFDNFRFYTSSYAELMAIYQDGTVGIGTNLGDVNTAGYKLKVAGTSNFTGAMTVDSTITATGNITAPAFYQSSDIRLKNILEPLDCTLEDIASIPTLYYELKSNPNKVEIGTIAQELLDKFPQLVDVDNNGYYKVEYSKLAIIAIKGIKLLLDELNKLKQIK